ncbi:MAG: hypothetical protein IPL61_05590 [Myxococcales bacterium]|nr:hypothetical protein [Myxococcales bacterium]
MPATQPTAQPSALLWLTRRTEGAGPIADGPFRQAGAPRPMTVLEVRAVDATDPRPAVTVTDRDLIGLTTVARADVTALGCAAAADGRWALVAVAGARVALARGSPPSVAAMARLLSEELALPRLAAAEPATALVPPGWIATRMPDDALALGPRRSSRALVAGVAGIALGAAALARALGSPVDAAIGAGVQAALVGAVGAVVLHLGQRYRRRATLDRRGLRWAGGGAAGALPLAAIDRFLAPGPGDDVVVVVADDRARPVFTETPGARAIATALNLELDRLRAPGRR